MSVIVEDPESGMVIMMTKGADIAIFNKLSESIDQPFR
jgi:magnesium-transporting ATPase (P-type)